LLAEWNLRALDGKLSERASRPYNYPNELHLRRLIRDDIPYYHEDRIHDSLEKDSPFKRVVAFKPDQSGPWIRFHASAACIIAAADRLPEDWHFFGGHTAIDLS
jgi:hypothetical protein